MRQHTTNIHRSALENLEFPLVLNQVSEYCITQSGKRRILEITTFKSVEEIPAELHRVKEIKDSFNNDNPIPNHGFESIDRDIHLLNIENSTLDVSGFRRILTVDQTTQIIKKFFKKYEEFYAYMHPFSDRVMYNSLIS